MLNLHYSKKPTLSKISLCARQLDVVKGGQKGKDAGKYKKGTIRHCSTFSPFPLIAVRFPPRRLALLFENLHSLFTIIRICSLKYTLLPYWRYLYNVS